MSKFVITYTPCFRKSMVKELFNVDRNIKISKVLDDSVLIIESELDTVSFLDKIQNQSPIFVKHLMPIMEEGIISENLDIDKINILNDIKKITNLSEKDKFAVQCRIVKGSPNGRLPYSSKDLEVFVGQEYEKQGCTPVFSDNNLKNENIDIISILINNDNYYVGFSNSSQNLNFHCDEYRICSKNGREISRAENKLKEALIKFGINLSGEGYALDIGAAPGGWTKVLADHGYNVIAVDPGDLKPELEKNPKIKHFKCRIEDLDFNNFFDIIVNDMNVDPKTTASIMNNLSNTLKENGLAVVTLKLPDKVEADIDEAVQILSKNYDVLTIKSLFHNRQEVTTLIKKKSLINNLTENNTQEKNKCLTLGKSDGVNLR